MPQKVQGERFECHRKIVAVIQWGQVYPHANGCERCARAQEVMEACAYAHAGLGLVSLGDTQMERMGVLPWEHRHGIAER